MANIEKSPKRSKSSITITKLKENENNINMVKLKLKQNSLFEGEPFKVLFGFCISDCSGTGSNVDGTKAVQVLSDLKSYNGGEFRCNGGAFFWVADDDTNGSWSNGISLCPN